MKISILVANDPKKIDNERKNQIKINETFVHHNTKNTPPL